MATQPLIKIGPRGKKLTFAAKSWDAVLDERTGLMWAQKALKVPNWREEQVKKTTAAIGKLTLGGFKDWRIPTVEELFAIADRTRTSPAINIDFFPHCPSDWFWTSTPWAPSPGDDAWLVSFYYGGAGCGFRDDDGFVRAVRGGQ